MEKTKHFETELNYIKDLRLKESASLLINLLPDYFFVIPASSTGKYHPKYALGNGGLIRHTKVAVKIANELLSNNSIGEDFTDNEKDIIIISLMIHDGLKLGQTYSQYTVFEHPILIANLVRENQAIVKLTNDEVALMTSILESHMGEWTTNRFGKQILKKPTTKYQKFGHLCDYLASRKFINVDFFKNEII
ncbi:MAG: hypothetical protein WDA12_02175 [Bacilli bacterium]